MHQNQCYIKTAVYATAVLTLWPLGKAREQGKAQECW